MTDTKTKMSAPRTHAPLPANALGGSDTSTRSAQLGGMSQSGQYHAKAEQQTRAATEVQG